MAKYAIIEGPIEAQGGVSYKVKLIPEVESEFDHTEIQEYFVAEGLLAEDVLSAAAINHENGIKKILNPEVKGEEAVVEVAAKSLKDIPEELQDNIQF